jgi:hypothetical protein
MRKETKEIIYIVLDFLESFARTSRGNRDLIYINKTVLEDVKKELFSLLEQAEKTKSYRTVDKKTELIGTLPSVLIDKNKFPTNESIVKLAEKSLNLKITNWKKKSRNEIIGILIAKIAEKDISELDLFIKAWKEFTEQKEIKKEHAREDFVDLWLKFFEHYRKSGE